MEQFDLKEKLLSVNGFEDIAISRAFGSRIDKLPEMECVRAVIFTLAIRDGADRQAAFQTAMNMTAGEVQASMLTTIDDLDPSEQETSDAEYAQFVMSTGMPWLPDQYRELTAGQRIALIDAAKRQRG